MNFKQKKEIRKEIGMLFQGAALFDSATVQENVMYPLDMFTQLSYEEKLQRVNFCLERVNMKGFNKLYPSELSGGMRKRVGIARAISLNPKYLFPGSRDHLHRYQRSGGPFLGFDNHKRLDGRLEFLV